MVEEYPQLPSEDEAKPWGLWATIGFSAIVFGLYCFLQLLVTIVLASSAKAEHPGLNLEAYVKSLSSKGSFVAIITIVSGLICIPLTIWLAKLRRNISVRDYIGFKEPCRREWGRWLLVLAIVLIASDLLTLLLHRPIVPPFMLEAYQSGSFLPGLLFAIIVVAPIFEEIFFRGFLFQGLRYSRLGPKGAIGITSLFWAAIHLQYDLYGMGTILVLGLLFGIARLKTDSIHLVMVMHSLTSVVATIETILWIHFGGAN